MMSSLLSFLGIDRLSVEEQLALMHDIWDSIAPSVDLTSMSVTMKNLRIDRLSVDERIELAGDIWDNIADKPGVIHLSDAQMQELERRLADHEANPGQGIPWEEVKARATARDQK